MFQRLIAKFTRTLDKAGVGYMLIGGQAVLLHGHPRLTQDIDITIDATADRVDAVLALAAGAGLQPLVPDSVAFVRQNMVLPLSDGKSGLRVDVSFGDTPYERQAIARAATVRVGRRAVHVTTVEDLIIQKVIAGRPRDIEDVRVVVARHPS